jgi:hypothetical protein
MEVRCVRLLIAAWDFSATPAEVFKAYRIVGT